MSVLRNVGYSIIFAYQIHSNTLTVLTILELKMINLRLTPRIVYFTLGKAALACVLVPTVLYKCLVPSTPLAWGSLLIASYAFCRWIARGVSCTCRHSLQGKVALVTGGNSGIGREVVKDLCAHDCHVFLTCRNVQKGKLTALEIRKENTKALVTILPLDLSDSTSIINCANLFQSYQTSLDYLINNAGVFYLEGTQCTADGFEAHYGTNYLGHYLLTRLLMGELKRSHARVVCVSSIASFLTAPREINALEYLYPVEGRFAGVSCYGVSKLANALDARALHLEHSAVGITSVSVHPGAVMSNLYDRILPRSFYNFISRTFLPLVFQTSQQGSHSILHCIYSKQLTSGEFYADCKEIPRIFQHPAMMSDEAALEFSQATEGLWKKKIPSIQIEVAR